VKLNGWAVESRIYAEDPYRNFLPSIGRLVRYRPPAEARFGGITVRNDTGVYEGGEISMFYDPMIAKLVTHAPTRSAAIDAQSRRSMPSMSTASSTTFRSKRVLNGYRLTWRGMSVNAHVFSGREAELARLMPEKKPADTSKKLLCPMPGLVVSIAVAEGQDVKAGDPLAIVEAMKMENILRAERDVTVRKLNAKKGDSLQVDAVIMEFA
jgi:acetyl/propionyl-CoA carboxylase alpha subunit